MELLVLATDYPKNNEDPSLMYIHTRNQYYAKNNIKVTVLNFKTHRSYKIDNINVISLQEYKKNPKLFDILVSHAPNLRNHFFFLNKYGKNFPATVFFFHGHEVLQISEVYPKPYDYIKSSPIISQMIRNLYDEIKFKVWKKYFTKTISKSYFVFVSNWMFHMFLKYIKLDALIIEPRTQIIPNAIGKNFESSIYDINADKKYDFITIRNNLDGAKYCIDLVTNIALCNPKYTFCVIGKGNFYKYNKKPENLLWINKNLDHSEVIRYLNISRCALMPTRTDSQGVMACEIATFGMPLITSNIDVCEEIFCGFKNVFFIDNEIKNINLDSIYSDIKKWQMKGKNLKYFSENTMLKEINLFQRILNG
ncbi:MAG: glycosyltransferase [Aminobacterium sp.]|nr:glycosyltransferase [Aminobacterium sp.]MEA4877930.1 glycosyltransferase [Aminobacterium sp.]